MRDVTRWWVPAIAVGVLGLGSLGCGDDGGAAAGPASGGSAGAAGKAGAAGTSGGKAGSAGSGSGAKAGAAGTSGGAAGSAGGAAGTSGASGGSTSGTGGSAGAGGSNGTSGEAGQTSAGAAGSTVGGSAGSATGGAAGSTAGGAAGQTNGGAGGSSAGGAAGSTVGGAAGQTSGGAAGAGGAKVFECTEKSDCPGVGAVCDPLQRKCVVGVACSFPGDCGFDFTCENQGATSTKACYLVCNRQTNDCPSGMVCSGCTSPDDCFGDTCRYPGGAARGAPCERSATLSGCEAGLACRGFLEPVCLATCDFESATPSCPSGESCHPDNACRPNAAIDPAAIDGACDPNGGPSFDPFYCAVAGGKVRGECKDDGAGPVCRAFCTKDTDCGNGKICVESGDAFVTFSVCAEDPVGLPCESANDCVDTNIFVCEPQTKTCQLPCDKLHACSAGGFCASQLGDKASCYATCAVGGSSCGVGSTCEPLAGNTTVGTCRAVGSHAVGDTCSPGGAATACGANARCVRSTCRQVCDYWGNGAPCGANEVCAPDGICQLASEVDKAKIDGFCGLPGSGAADPIACGGITAGAGAQKAIGRCNRRQCAVPCRSGKNDCGAGEVCTVFGFGEDLGECEASTLGSTCTADDDCRGGPSQTCDPGTKKCIAYACNATTCGAGKCVPDGDFGLVCDSSCRAGDPPTACAPGKTCASIDLAGDGICTVIGTSALGETCNPSESTGCVAGLVCTEDLGDAESCQPRCDGFAGGKPCGDDGRCDPSAGACVRLLAGEVRAALGEPCSGGVVESALCGDDGGSFRGLCSSIGKSRVCLPVCRGDADCAPGLFCVGDTPGYAGVCR